jgi:hypothetical protein
MYWPLYFLGGLYTIAVEWAVPILGVTLLLPLLQIVFTLQPLVAAGVMGLLGGLLVYYCIHHGLHWQALLWELLCGLGALTAALGVFHWYALFVESVLVILLLVPGIVAPGWLQILRWYATGELALTVLLIWGQEVGLPGVTLVMDLLLLALATLLGLGAYRPFETRRLRRRFATMATLAAILLLLWQPLIIPAANWAGQAAQTAGQAVGQAVATSPIGRWYHVAALQAERLELGERAKTEALRELQGSLTDAHKRRWEKGISQVPQIPLTGEEWRDLGVPRDP